MSILIEEHKFQEYFQALMNKGSLYDIITHFALLNSFFHIEDKDTVADALADFAEKTIEEKLIEYKRKQISPILFIEQKEMIETYEIIKTRTLEIANSIKNLQATEDDEFLVVSNSMDDIAKYFMTSPESYAKYTYNIEKPDDISSELYKEIEEKLKSLYKENKFKKVFEDNNYGEFDVVTLSKDDNNNYQIHYETITDYYKKRKILNQKIDYKEKDINKIEKSLNDFSILFLFR